MKRRMTETADDIDCGSIENLIAVWYCHQDCIRKHFDFVERKFRLPDHDDCNAKCPSVCSPPPSPAMPPVAPPPSPTQPFPPPIPSLVPPSPSPPSPPPPSPSSPLPSLPPVPRCRAAGNVWPPRCRDAHAGRDYAEIIRDCPILRRLVYLQQTISMLTDVAARSPWFEVRSGDLYFSRCIVVRAGGARAGGADAGGVRPGRRSSLRIKPYSTALRRS